MEEEFQIEIDTKGIKEKIYCKQWKSKLDKKAGVIIAIHGLNEHTNRYNSFFNCFAAQGFEIYGFDLPGHGRTFEINGVNNDLTSFATVISIVKELIKRKTEDVPLILFGHSMGGLIAIYVLEELHDLFNYAIIQGAAIKPGQDIPYLKEKLGMLFSSIMPGFKIHNGLDAKYITRKPEEVESYVNDKLISDKISLGLANIVLSEGKKFSEKHVNWNKTKVLISHGGGDKLTCCAATEHFAKLNNFQFLKKDGWYHELHVEDEQEIFNDYISFLKS